MPIEFDCAACKRHVFSFGYVPPNVTLCATCENVPGWYLDPELRDRLDPDFDDAIRAVTPDEFINFEIHRQGGGHIPVHELVSLEGLHQAYAEGGEHGMWQAVRIALIKMDRR